MQEISIHDKKFGPFLSEEKIQQSILLLAERIKKDYEGKRPVFVVVLNGAFIFASELFKNYGGEAEISFIKVSSYEGTGTTGTVKEILGFDESLKGKDLLLVEDIVDTGITLEKLLEKAKELQPASLKTASLLFKPMACIKPVKPDYIGFEVANDFLVGFGLDYNGLGRNLKSIYKLSTP
jgi:hypoxanthine phosphoribosyltransferase